MPGGAPTGNNNRAKNKPWSDAIRKFAKQNPNKRDKVIEKLYEQALSGDLPAIREIMDRTEGKPAQAIVGDPDQPLTVNICKMVTDSDD